MLLQFTTGYRHMLVDDFDYLAEVGTYGLVSSADQCCHLSNNIKLASCQITS